MCATSFIVLVRRFYILFFLIFDKLNLFSFHHSAKFVYLRPRSEAPKEGFSAAVCGTGNKWTILSVCQVTSHLGCAGGNLHSSSRLKVSIIYGKEFFFGLLFRCFVTKRKFERKGLLLSPPPLVGSNKVWRGFVNFAPRGEYCCKVRRGKFSLAHWAFLKSLKTILQRTGTGEDWWQDENPLAAGVAERRWAKRANISHTCLSHPLGVWLLLWQLLYFNWDVTWHGTGVVGHSWFNVLGWIRNSDVRWGPFGRAEKGALGRLGAFRDRRGGK